MQLTLDEIRQQLEMLIGVTPTGDVRNALSDANIHLAVAQACEILGSPVPAGTTTDPGWAGPLLRRSR
jgi:hypothetical protein